MPIRRFCQGQRGSLGWPRAWGSIRLVARGIIEGSKRPFFSHLADPSQQVYLELPFSVLKYPSTSDL